MTGADLVRFAVNALIQHRRRSLLSLLGVVIGVVAVISLTALGEGARRFVTDQFASLGSGVLMVMPGRNELTRMPWSPTSLARPTVKQSTAAFEAA